jgi:membrane-associated phospholipid phosphatase
MSAMTMQTAAKIISYIFHPLLFATYLVLVLGWIIPHFLLLPPAAILPFTGFVFAMTFILPVANLIMFRAFGTLTSLQMPTRRERLLPFTLITIIYIVVTIMFFYKVRVNVNFNKVMLIVCSMVLVATIATFFQKLSVHSLAICGALGIMLPLNKVVESDLMLWPTIIVLTLAGVVMSSRLYLNAHTPREVMVGGVSGFSIGFFGMLLLF